MNRAVFLDRDGVINALVHRPEEGIFDSPYALGEFQLLPGVAEAIRLVNAMGFLAVVVSNQPGVAKGKCDAAMLEQLTGLMCQELAARGARLDGVHYCLHHPEGVVPHLRRKCECRKPKPGLLLEAAREHSIDPTRSYLIGDSPKDIEAGLAVGCTTILLGEDPGSEISRPHLRAADLLEAITKVQRGG